jgi:hypothetical protein
MAKKVLPLSPIAVSIFNLMKAEGKALTLAEVQALGITEANASHFTALRNRGLIASEQIEKEVVTVAKRKVNVYTLVDGATIAE